MSINLRLAAQDARITELELANSFRPVSSTKGAAPPGMEHLRPGYSRRSSNIAKAQEILNSKLARDVPKVAGAVLLSLLIGGCALVDWIPKPIPNPTPTPAPVPTPLPEPTPTPPPTVGKPFPQGVPEAEYIGMPATSEHALLVNSVMAEITGCLVGSRCMHNKSPQEWMQLVVTAIRERGIDAGQHIEGHTDEIAVRVAPSCRWEGYHITTHGDRSTVVWSPGAKRPSWRIPSVYCKLPPVPAPTPDPDVSACPSPQPTRAALELTVKAHGPKDWDLTPKQRRSCDYCASIGMGRYGENGVMRCSCPVRPEGNEFRSACEQFIMGGPPRWYCDGVEIPSNDNPYQARCEGVVKACTTDLEVCS